MTAAVARSRARADRLAGASSGIADQPEADSQHPDDSLGPSMLADLAGGALLLPGS